MAIDALIDYLRDPYQRTARVFPGLLTALPLLIPLLWILGPRSPILTALLALVTSCGAIYGLASGARGLGKRLEERLIKNWGGMPTTIILRHRDSHLDNYTKSRYHKIIGEKLQITLPSIEEEERDPTSSDQIYSGVTRHLRELTRGKKYALLLKENIAYGFHRNMLAMKPIGLCTSAIGIFFGLLQSQVIQFAPLHVQLSKLLTPGTAAGITLFGATAILFSWLYFTEAHLKRIGYAYAERLFESACDIDVSPPKESVRKAPRARAAPRAATKTDDS
ncbi:hypothetical protein [Burkholderia contaminans]|uniref:hypothetical protein n=1 Tax=Burkholderia contaminans TaxID=488447 RepID=UPI0014539740|nr:hypothetical protein [Burkholderia contaminans]VWD48341.1 hypothetical protein BCO18442_05900 [Burkholderia contaminans]